MARSSLIDSGGLNKLLVCYEDITGRDLWPPIQEALSVRLPLSDVTFENKFKKCVTVNELDIEFLPMKHQRIQRLRQSQSNSTTWFRLPYCHIIIVTAAESTDYKAVVRPKLNMMLNGPRGTLETLCEALIVYIRPPEADPYAKGPRKVYDKLRDDFNPKKGNERCVRLDLYDATQLKDAQGMIVGLDMLETTIKECIRTAFQTRQTAYDEEARKLMSHRMDMRGDFGKLFLVKDSLALMSESVRLLDDALREYYELEAAFLEALEEGGALYGQPFGGDEKGDDVAVLMTATWKSVHQSVLAHKPLKEFKLRQYLFSAQSRLLFRLNRPTEVVDRALKFIQDFSKLISEHETAADVRPSLREVWAFSACLSVASTAAKYYSTHDHEMQSRPGQWYGQDATEKARIQLSEVDWDVGVCGLEDVTADLDFDSLGGHFKRTAHRLRDGQRDVRHWHFYSSLGHLYASAREELRRIFDVIYGVLETGSAAPEGLGGFHADMLPSFTPVCLSASRAGSVDATRRLSVSVQRTSSLIESLQKRVSGRRMLSQQLLSVGSEGQLSFDAEGMPSWMTRAGLANTPRHSRRNTVTQLPTPPESPHGSAGSFVSVASDAPQPVPQESEKEEEIEVASVISYETALTALTSSQLGESANLTLHSVGDGSAYASSMPPSESVISSLDQPLNRSIQRADTQSPRSLASHALGGSGFNPEASSDSYQGAMPSYVVPDKLSWVVDWRIRRALASEELYEDLFVELTLAAAWCYARCGRLRTSALLRVDVAPLLLNHGLTAAAQQLYHMKADMYLREGWNVLSAHVLPQLCACLRGDDPKQLMSACLTYLALQKDAVDEGEVQKMMENFTNCARDLGETDTYSPSTLIAAPALQIQPKRHCCSELLLERPETYDRDVRDVKIYSLAPEAVHRREDETPEHRPGALKMCAGDVAELVLEVHSQLPESIVLTDFTVCLTLVGEDERGAPTQTAMVDGIGDLSGNFSPPAEMAPKQQIHRSHSLQDPASEKLQKTPPQLLCAVQGGSEGVEICPGVTEILFHCCPVREGRYALMYAVGEYLNTSLCFPLSLEGNLISPLWTSGHPKRRYHLFETLEFLKPSMKAAVVLSVEPAIQRIDVTAVLPQGCFVTGQKQWLGFVLKGQCSCEMESGALTISVNHPTDAIRLPETANLTNKTSVHTEGIDAWVRVEDGRLNLPPGFLYQGQLVVWCLMDLTPVPPSTRRLSADLSRADRGCEFDATLNQDAIALIQAQLEYFTGCWRSHVALVSVPIWSPFAFESNFIKMNATSMLITIRLASQLPARAEIESVQLELHCPRKQNCRPALIGPHFPTELHPAEVMHIAFRLTKNEAKILAASAREADDHLVTGEFSMSYRSHLFEKHKPLQPAGKHETLTDIPFPPSQDEQESAVSEQICCFRASLELDVLMGGEGPKNDLFKISLLPPPTICSGTPVALTWMLERLGSLHSKEHISYEILPESGWQACVPLQGSIYVPSHSSASATLEAMFIAVSDGELQAPRLVLTQNKIQSPLVFLKVTSEIQQHHGAPPIRPVSSA